jgi:hypothetical protein
MARPYGKTRRLRTKAPKTPKGEGSAFKIRLRGKDGAPLSMQELRDGLFEAARQLKNYEATHRAKWATLYLTLVDEDGKEVMPSPSEMEIYPYKSAADDYKG